MHRIFAFMGNLISENTPRGFLPGIRRTMKGTPVILQAGLYMAFVKGDPRRVFNAICVPRPIAGRGEQI
jgi:hypothetical protein